MKSIIQTIVRVVSIDKRKRTVTLRLKGMEPNYGGCECVIVDGQTVLGLQMASKMGTMPLTLCSASTVVLELLHILRGITEICAPVSTIAE
uniref:Uncharacterized protein n=1 Tax=Candidatus Methanogaster sp. ANME-2c ERB4 TaxID=2759911 RepID=A0A7G9Y6W3_9EURY|nr:hypothetical protein BCIMGCOA_00009 [Methanosarcinales archaeon ANME-2c ERB4]QNO43845.1 hypothetical protein KKPOJJPN_00002 [Methanosarcinales archaeon ANME-2c ERB4]QNO46364.1 hypothetical protein KKGFGGCE_00002 [Methanosarcinales archaeon ANME-2c ERB4]QNO50580.1 hypothetical protein EJMHAFHI_00004 [Methanosarcinales archaeon ANME-2c ERB4]